MRKEIKEKKEVEVTIRTEQSCDLCGAAMLYMHGYDCKAEFIALGCHTRYDICSGCWQNKVKPWFESQKKK